jgi:hypothetical protein
LKKACPAAGQGFFQNDSLEAGLFHP